MAKGKRQRGFDYAAAAIAAKIVQCREPECGADIVFVKTPAGSTMPVDAKPTKGYVIDVATMSVVRSETVFVSHFKTCTNPERFGKARRL